MRRLRERVNEERERKHTASAKKKKNARERSRCQPGPSFVGESELSTRNRLSSLWGILYRYDLRACALPLVTDAPAGKGGGGGFLVRFFTVRVLCNTLPEV